jgi:HEAT repeat protein
MLKFVPRRYDLGPRSRAAAVWALGHIHAGDPDPEVGRAMAERVADAGDFPRPEPVEVRANAAVSLGRMKAEGAMEVLRAFYNRGPPGDPVREACGWAIEQITGEDLPDPATKRIVPLAPFLQPLQPDSVSASP